MNLYRPRYKAHEPERLCGPQTSVHDVDLPEGRNAMARHALLASALLLSLVLASAADSPFFVKFEVRCWDKLRLLSAGNRACGERD